MTSYVYDPARMIPIILKMMGEGASKEEVAPSLGISKRTLYGWQKDPDKPEFAQALEEGEGLSQAWWERVGRTSLENQQFSYTGWYMNMKNRFKWSDRSEQHNTGTMTVNWPLGKSTLDE